ncbi:MAG: hypothetical protein N3A69_08510, partial [Leptospiraceae bacterium]|nr:hypothetical protein [Leptospiraceae bacterium]
MKLILIALLLFPFSLSIASPLKIGDELSKENLVQFIDQHGNLQTIPKDTKYLLFASDMEASKIVHPFLLNLKQEGLNTRKIVFLAD